MSLAGGPWLLAELHGGEDSDGCVRCCGMNVRPFAWSWLQPFTTAGVGGSGRTKAYGHRRQPARVLPSTSNFPLMMAGPLGRERPAALLEPWPQGEVQRHAGIGYELAQNLDVPALQMGEQLPDVLQLFASVLPVVPEHVIEVPKIFLDTTPQRLGDHLRQPQMVEQLVHVPTVVSFLSLQQLTAEQIVDIPVPGGDGGGERGGLQGFAGQGSTASSSHVSAADGAEQGVFRTFPRMKKSAKRGPHSGSELGADFNPSTLSSHQMPPEQLVDVPGPLVHERSSYDLETRLLLGGQACPCGRGADG